MGCCGALDRISSLTNLTSELMTTDCSGTVVRLLKFEDVGNSGSVEEVYELSGEVSKS